MRYNGWTNYETWAVKLWIDNEQGSQEYWKEAAQTAWNRTGDKSPNQFMDHASNARCQLAEHLQDEHSHSDEHPVLVFAAAESSVYADLLNAALSEVNWYEIADSLLEEVEKEAEEEVV